MHIEARLFEILTAFFALATVGYGALTALYANGGIEWAGTTALVLTTGLSLIIGTFFRFVARRLDTRPEDYEDAEVADGRRTGTEQHRRDVGEDLVDEAGERGAVAADDLAHRQAFPLAIAEIGERISMPPLGPGLA